MCWETLAYTHSVHTHLSCSCGSTVSMYSTHTCNRRHGPWMDITHMRNSVGRVWKALLLTNIYSVLLYSTYASTHEPFVLNTRPSSTEGTQFIFFVKHVFESTFFCTALCWRCRSWTNGQFAFCHRLNKWNLSGTHEADISPRNLERNCFA